MNSLKLPKIEDQSLVSTDRPNTPYANHINEISLFQNDRINSAQAAS